MSLQPGDTVDLRGLLPDQPDINHDGINLHLGSAYSFSKGSLWGVTIEKCRRTKGGNQGKPEKLVTLTADKDTKPSDLLRMVADLLDQGEIAVT